jgi:hypothetical protein
MAILTETQEREYTEKGYLLISGLVPSEVSQAAYDAMWRALDADPNDPSTWAPAMHHKVYEPPELAACYAPDVLVAAALLAGDDPATFKPPARGYAINVFPQEGEWRWPNPHIDHAIKEHGHKTFPRAFRIASMLFLNDVPPHGAGTVVWPGSHQKLLTLAQSDPEKYELMWTLNQELKSLDLGEPIELTPKRGDVLFYHYLCAHAGSMNTSTTPRLAMNMKW